MIDSTLQGLTIPEGAVTQIADASGMVLWSAVENLTVTMTQANPRGVTAGIYCSGGNISEPGTYQVPAGTEMKASIYHRDTLTDVYPYVIFNGTSVGTSSSSGFEYGASYYFTLTKDITFYVGTYGKGAYALFIEEV